MGVKKIEPLFKSIRSVGIPGKVTDAWIKQIGLTSSNDTRLKSVLNRIGFTDSAGVPTQLWRDYRGSSGPAKLAQGIREGYADLFHTYSDANLRSEDEISAFMRAQTSLGSETISKAVSTFRSLVGLADFGQDGAASPTPPLAEPRIKGSGIDRDNPETGQQTMMNRPQGADVTVNVNVQLTLPESTDPTVYDALFFALNKHVLSRNNSGS